MYNIERKEQIINMLEKDKEVDVKVLSNLFGVSKETIRRDLCELEGDGILTRTHGGAIYNSGKKSSGEEEYPLAIRSIQRYSEKNAICRFAATLIDDNDTIFVDNSSTTMYLVNYIPQDIHVTIVTNSLKLLLEAAKVSSPNVSFFCLGGTFKISNLSFYGNTTIKNASSYYPNKSFVSCAGIRPDGILTDSSMQEVDTKRLMLEQSTRTVLLADYTKFTSSGQVFLSNITPRITIITDSKAPDENISVVTKLGAELIKV